GTLMGLNQATAKDCLSSHCRGVIIHAETRRNTTRAVISVNPVSSLTATEQWKLGDKRKKDSDSKDAAHRKKAKEPSNT
ncbi:hypothetical protein BGZ49_009837, partial [Haplosporangium sp. Z 27]